MQTPPWTCMCNHRCLAKRRILAVRSFLRSEESLNLCGIHAIYRHMPKPCLWCVDLKNVRAGTAKVILLSFDCPASENIQRGLLKIFFYDGMFSVGIAAAGINHFKGSLYNFASITQWFLRQHTFQLETSQSNLVRRTIVHKTFYSSRSKMLRLWFLACSPWNYWALERLHSSCCLRVFKISEKSLPLSSLTVILKNHFSALCSFSWLLGSSMSRSDSILIPHAQSLLSVCLSNFKFKFIKLDVYIQKLILLGDLEIK